MQNGQVSKQYAKSLLEKLTKRKPDDLVLPLHFGDCGLNESHIDVMRTLTTPKEVSDIESQGVVAQTIQMMEGEKAKEMKEIRAALLKELTKARQAEDTCEKVFRDNLRQEDAWTVWRQVHLQSWLDSQWMNRLRLELGCCRDFCSYLQKLTSNELSVEASYHFLLKVKKIFAYSVFLTEDSPMKFLLTTRIDTIKMFMEEMWKLFSYDRGYYSFFEIVCGRQDLNELAEGKILKLSLSEHSFEEVFDCKWIYQYKLSRQMRRHMDLVYEPHVELLLRLRTVNSSRPVEQTCQCGEKKLTSSVVTCYLCHSTFHSQCISWEPALNTLPKGIYLCQRCLRGKRPSICIMSCMLQSPCYETTIYNTYEYQMIHWFVDYSMKVCDELKSALQSCSNALDDKEEADRLERLIMKYLSLQCHNRSVNKVLVRHPFFKGSLLHDTEILDEVKQRHNGQRNPPKEIFANSHWTEPAVEDHRADGTPWCDEQQNPVARNCAHHHCLQPFAEQILWIQCTRCRKWFHYVCARVTIQSVESSKHWECERCGAAPSPRTSVPKSRKRRRAH
uniref:PHD domain-containing protein n=1 Tax=Steinernema glaseri TaxID=37863 RepID=A0A1I7Y7A0_9BILA